MTHVVHKKIMQTRDAFVDSDGFHPEEAMEAVVDKISRYF